MKIIEHFVSIQGEGIRTGRPSLFIRTAGCNLKCVFHSGDGRVASICDTSYASFNPDPSTFMNFDKAKEECIQILKENPGVTDVVVTGGEPLLDQEGLVSLIADINTYAVSAGRDLTWTVETNGSITPGNTLLEMVDLWSVSPKLSSSTPAAKDLKKYGLTTAAAEKHESSRINLHALSTIILFGHDLQLKFVYAGPESEQEIKSLARDIQDCLDAAYEQGQGLIDHEEVNRYIMLMPEGITSKAILGKSDECVQACIRNGWTFTSRMHILIWGNVKEK